MMRDKTFRVNYDNACDNIICEYMHINNDYTMFTP